MAADKPTKEELRQLIDKANAESELLAAREEMIGLFESDEWRIANSAETTARKILREWGQWGTRCEIEEYCLQKLKDGFPIRAIGMGEPQGSAGVGYVMKNVDGKSLYIKLKIEEDGFRKLVKILSFKH